MDNKDYSTKQRKYQHLSRDERYEIQVRLKNGWSIYYRIAKALNRSDNNTIKQEIARGMAPLYSGNVRRYKAEAGQRAYEEHRSHSRKRYKRLDTAPFMRYVEEKFDEGWSLDAIAGRAKAEGLFRREEMVCTKTLYNYADLGLINIRNIDLPQKLRRRVKKKRVRENKRVLGESITQRPESVESREEFGHWEIDSVIGTQDENEPAVMTIVERKTRFAIWIKVAKIPSSNK